MSTRRSSPLKSSNAPVAPILPYTGRIDRNVPTGNIWSSVLRIRLDGIAFHAISYAVRGVRSRAKQLLDTASFLAEMNSGGFATLGGVMSVLELLTSRHRSIRTSFEELSQQRTLTQTPLYFAEHGLEPVELAEVGRCIQLVLSSYSLSHEFWQSAYLPLIVFATDMGYQYEGNGTDFWPTLELQLSYRFDSDDRQRLSGWFDRTAEEFGGIRPPETDWAAAFHHIAWPITHAVLAKDIRGAFTESLRAFTGDVDLEDERLIQRFVRFRPPTWSRRYAAWLMNEKLACALIRDLLVDRATFDVGVLSESFRNRLFNDLKKDPEFRRAVRAARRNSKLLPKRVSSQASLPSNAPTEVSGALYLRIDASDNFELRGQLPEIPRDVRRRLNDLIRLRRWRPRPWGFNGGTPLPRGAMTLNEQFPLPFGLVRRATNELPFFSTVDDVGLEDADSLILARIRMPAGEKLAFIPPHQGEEVAELISTRRPKAGLIWVVVPPSSLPPKGTFKELGKIESGVVLELDAAEPTVRHWLEWPTEHIESPKRTPRLRFLTAPFLGDENELPVLLLNDPIIADIDSTEFQRVVLKKEGKPIAEQLGNGLIEINCNSAGQYCLDLCDDAGVFERFPFQVLGTDQLEVGASSPCELSLRGLVTTHGSPISKRDLVTGKLQLTVGCTRSIQNIAVTLRIKPGGSVVTIDAECLPIVLGAGHAVWAMLTEQLSDRILSDPCDLFLTVEVGELVHQTWRLEAEIATVWWDLSAVEPRAINESGEYSLSVRNIVTHELTSLTQINREPMIAVPLLKNGEPSLFDGLVLTGNQTAWPGTIQRPRRLLRELSDREDGLGLRTIAERYVSTATAASASKVAELHRRSASEQYRALLIESCCGEVWTQRSLSHAPVESLEPVSVFWQSLVDNKAGIPEDVLTNGNQTEDLFLAAIPRLKQLLPERWWDGPVPLINDDDAYRLDALFQQLLPSSRVFTETVVWQETMRQACSRFNGEHLAELVVPAAGGDELMETVICDTPLTELAEQLRDWIRKHLRSGRGRQVWSADELSDWLSLLLAPQELRKRPWEDVLPKLLADRCVARAGAFIAWRFLRSANVDSELNLGYREVGNGGQS